MIGDVQPKQRLVEKVLRFRIKGSRKPVVVAGDAASIDALIKLLARAGESGKGIPPKTCLRGVVATMDYGKGDVRAAMGSVWYPEPGEVVEEEK